MKRKSSIGSALSVNMEEVEALVKKLSGTTSTGDDTIPALVLKDGFSVLGKPLLYLINLSIETCTFPNKWIIGKIGVHDKNMIS